jgi:hypothetical protein
VAKEGNATCSPLWLMRIKSRTLVLKGGAGGNVAGCWEGGG